MSSSWLDVVAVYLALLKQIIPVLSVLLALSSIDDLLIDLAFAIRWVWRKLTVYSVHQPFSADRIADEEEGWIAILVPALWEAGVIGNMLRSALSRLEYKRYRILVGVYPNDPATRREVRAVAAADPRVLSVMGTEFGGRSTKASCLNTLYAALQDLEARGHPPFKAVVLHDAEDVIHPRELQVFNRLIPRKAMVQLPVIPLPHRGLSWWGHTYLDEFAEAHAKDLVVREWLGASLPSAGVGCALSREALAEAARSNGGRPFKTDSKTEDYELGINLGRKGLATILVRMPAAVHDLGCVATRSYFPQTFAAAVRQRSRWLLGITLAGWRRLGWSGKLVDRYMLLRDRKSLPCAYLNTFALLVFLQMLLVLALSRHPGWPDFPPLVEPSSLTFQLLILNGFMAAWRSIIRASITTWHYGAVQGALSVPRSIFAIFINASAATGALYHYARERLTGRPTAWRKTMHSFPS